jgi:hypothetical protein
LRFDGVDGVAEEMFDGQVLFDPFEKAFDRALSTCGRDMREKPTGGSEEAANRIVDQIAG